MSGFLPARQPGETSPADPHVPFLSSFPCESSSIPCCCPWHSSRLPCSRRKISSSPTSKGRDSEIGRSAAKPSGKVRRQDIMFSLGSLSGSSDYGGLACWRFFTSNYDRLFAELGTGPMWPGCVGLCCRGLRSEDDVKDVERFFSTHELGSAQRRLTQALEVVQVQIRRRERDRDSLENFLSQYSAT